MKDVFGAVIEPEEIKPKKATPLPQLSDDEIRAELEQAKADLLALSLSGEPELVTDVPLPGVVNPAKIYRAKGGLEPPSVGDLIVCECWVGLPKKGPYLVEELHFENRVRVLGKDLNWSWSGASTRKPGYLSHECIGLGRTYPEAFALALHKARAGLAPLLAKLQERHERLMRADDMPDTIGGDLWKQDPAASHDGR